jgi:hypothetical protein
VVREEQFDDYKPIAMKYGCKILRLPEGSSGIAQARRQIAEHKRGERYWVIDDDISFRCVVWDGSPGRGYTNHTHASEDQYREAISEIHRFMDEGFVSGGAQAGITPPDPAGYCVCSRVFTNMFFSENFPVDEVSWGEEWEVMPEDFHVMLQLLEMGLPSIILGKFRANIPGTNDPGGLADYRTIENHNVGQEALAELHPDFVTVYEKTQLSGPWKGLPKKALRIQWKKAFQSSGKPLPTLPEWATGKHTN